AFPNNPNKLIYSFGVSASAYVGLRAFGFDFGSVSISFSVSATGSGHVPIIVEASAKPSFLFFSGSVHMHFTLGYVELPKPIYLAGSETDPFSLAPDSNGTLVLNTGSRAVNRGVAEDEPNEAYIIDHLGSDPSGEIVKVTFGGRSQV